MGYKTAVFSRIFTCSQFLMENQVLIIFMSNRMGTDSGSHYRAEIKDANNEAKGIYSWIDPLGNAHTTAFNAGQNGYQVLPVPKSGLVLPPFPYGLYQARPQEAQARIKVESKPEPALYRPPSSPSTYQEDDDVVVIGPDPEQPEPESPLGDDLLGGFQIQPGTPVAASRPTATAVAGEKGTAQVQPQSQASVGPGGVAIAFPTASAGVGPGGVAVARPVAVSSAGDGGIAIAGGTSTAFAGLDGSSTQHVLVNKKFEFSHHFVFVSFWRENSKSFFFYLNNVFSFLSSTIKLFCHKMES